MAPWCESAAVATDPSPSEHCPGAPREGAGALVCGVTAGNG